MEPLFSSGFSSDETRLLAGVCFVATGLLYLYRLSVIIRCMGTPSEMFRAPIDRLIYVGLALLVPLGVGAYVFDLVFFRKVWKPLFIIPFVIVVFCIIIFVLPSLLRHGNFTLDLITK